MLVSAVVPIYNVEEYLEECVHSIINQTYTELEIILVDDGSTDNSGILCDKFAKLDSRIRVVHKKNGGLSEARNCGLYLSTGELVCFIDSDDLIDTRMIETLVNALKQKNADIAVCKFQSFSNESPGGVQKELHIETNSGRDTICEILKGNAPKYAFVAWNKLYKTSLFRDNNIEYPVGRIYEDTFTTYKLLYNSKTVTLIDMPLYFYRERSGSIMKSSMTKKKLIDAVDSDVACLFDYYKWGENELLGYAVSYACKDLISFYNRLGMINREDRAECRNYLLNCYKEIVHDYMSEVNIGMRKKFVFKSFGVIPYLTAKIISLPKKWS